MTQCQEDLTTIYSQKLTLAKTIPKGFDILVSKYDQPDNQRSSDNIKSDESLKNTNIPNDTLCGNNNVNLNTIFSLQNIEDPSNYHKVSILRNSSKYLGVSSHLLDPNNSLRNNNKKTRFREDLVEIKEVESFKDFNYEHTYNVDNAQCKCECLLI